MCPGHNWILKFGNTTDFDLREVIPLQLESVVCGDHLRAAERESESDSRYGYHEVCTGTTRYVLSVNNVNEFFYLLLIHKAKSK
jgi:hypothetical protein